jgi:glutamyl-tRNA reductase
VPYVELILRQELDSFREYLSSLDILPLIAGLYEQAESIRQAELERTFRRLPDLNDLQRARLEAMTQALVRKLLEAPAHRLREQAAGPHRLEYALLARSLFGLGAAPEPSRSDEHAASSLSVAAD